MSGRTAPAPVSSPQELQRLMGAEHQLSEQQWAAVSAPLEPAVVVAGAGSGKTSLMAARVVYLVANGVVEPGQVLGLTFTTKAASELRSRVRSALAAAGLLDGAPGPAGARGAEPDDGDGDGDAPEPTVSTYHAYASSLLAEHGLRIGHEPDTRVLADASRYQLAARAIDRHTRPVVELTDSPKHVIDHVVRLESALGEHLVSPAQLRDFDARELPLLLAGLQDGPRTTLERVRSAFARRAEAMGLVEDYQRLKASLGLMDFSDQISLAARLADEHPVVGEQERVKFPVVLLDEYQDTSVAQAQVLSRLFGHGHAVMAVGDPNQAIYGWRGASVSNIIHFGDDFPRADRAPVTTYPLSVNRRSDARILQAANALAAPLLRELTQVEPLRAGTDRPGEVDVAVHESHGEELSWLAEQVVRAGAGPGSGWREIGVLVRDNAHAAEVFDALTAAGVPVEIVGLNGLLRLPEVAEVLATLTLLHDLTANAELLTLLTGPRWAVGPRDLALLGTRAEELAGSRPGRRATAAGTDADPTVVEELHAAVAGADPTEVPALCDALDDPGEHAYSAAARERFGLLAAELRQLRAHAGEPLLELVRRIIEACGIDVELASSLSEAARARRDNLDLFVKAVADFQAVDGTVTLASLLAWLEAEDDLGNGLDVATPTEADSVKLLTVHRAKGLEWDTVFLVGACRERFPHTRSRGQWPTRVDLLPSPLRGDARDLPVLGPARDKGAFAAFDTDTKAHEAAEELRLGYVALTRARHRLVVSSYVWHPGRKTPLGASPYQEVLRDTLASWGAEPLVWTETPAKDVPNPLRGTVEEHPWPRTGRTVEAERRAEAAALVREARDDPGAAAAAEAAGPLDLVDAARVQEWDDELEHLLHEARRSRAPVVDVPVPAALAATALAGLRDDPGGFAEQLARPMPRRPSPAAELGTVFHAWVAQRFAQQPLIDPDDLWGRADPGIDDADDLQELLDRFEHGPFASRPPLAVEVPFALVLAGQVVRGRIDAVYDDPERPGGYLLVDWKTHRTARADPLQLALYRLAWAELRSVPLEQVRAGFYYVRTGQLVEPPDLGDRPSLETVLGPRAPG